MKVKVGLTIKPELLAKIDAARGMVKRSTFIEHLINTLNL
jgi:metal-responsive CopG/Arc/MetJ family transcriptional regulator